ncbi:MAG: hypothetical protein KJO50_02360 [Bacteroidia bacterium]|nr:hypothetical protein [Bacteroidia bacterium]
MEEAVVFLFFMATIFGVFYLYFTTRHKERMALIDKGMNADLFVTSKRKSAIPFYAVMLINLGILAIGIGLGILIAQLLMMSGMDEDIAMPCSIFICLGLSLLTGFHITRKVDEKYREEWEALS